MSKVVLGFSGGVDSSVSACLLKDAGYEVYGLYLNNGDDSALKDAVETAERIGIPLRVLEIRAELEREVCAPFADCYRRGQTPNPCIICNPGVKFKSLLAYADSLGAQHIATGHYARAKSGMLFKGRPSNDQSYMLCRLTREQVSRLVLPLGEYEKTEVRALAERYELPVAHKPDSMEICFIPDKDYVSWLSRRGICPPPGDFMFHGEALGRHEGIHRYTVGQRRPGLFDERKLYISRIDAKTNTVELALWEELFKSEVFACDFSWLIDEPTEPLRASVRVRHTKWENPPCTAYIDGGMVRIVCDEPVRAPAAGQSAVLYDGDRLLGGGYIV